MSTPETFVFRLYVAGDSPNSVRALANLQAICVRHLPDRYTIEVVDLLIEPERMFTDNIQLTPTLVKLAPAPVRAVIGHLGDPEPVLDAFGIALRP